MANPEQTNADASLEQSNSNANIDYEKRFKDTQGAYTKSQQELKAAKAKAEALEKLLKPEVVIEDDVAKELESLKFSNPDEWRNKMNKLEIEAQNKHRDTLNEVTQQANQTSELEHRQQVLQDFQARNPNLSITDDVIKYDVPPRMTNKLENGEITFEQYLNEVAGFLGSPKIIGDGNKTLNQPNLTNVGGGHQPSDSAVKGDIVENYKNIVY